MKVAGTYEWREAISQLVKDSALRKRLASELYDWAVGEWHIDRHIHKWVNLYQEVVEQGPVRELEQIVRPGGQHGTVGAKQVVRPVDAGGQGSADIRD